MLCGINNVQEWKAELTFVVGYMWKWFFVSSHLSKLQLGSHSTESQSHDCLFNELSGHLNMSVAWQSFDVLLNCRPSTPWLVPSRLKTPCWHGHRISVELCTKQSLWNYSAWIIIIRMLPF